MLARMFFLLIMPRPPASTLFPYTTLFRSVLSLWSPREMNGFVRGAVAVVQTCDDVRMRVIAEPDERDVTRSEEHTSELQSRFDLVCRLLLEKKKYEQDTYRLIRLYYPLLP